MPPRDQFPSRSAGAAPRQWFAIVPDDNNDLSQVPQAIFVGIGGDLHVVGEDGHDEVFHNVAEGQYWIGAPVRVMAALTTADKLTGVV